MKLSKYTSVTITSASLVVYGFGVVSNVLAQTTIVGESVSEQIVEVLGAGDTDEQLVDDLTKTESDLKEIGVGDYSSTDDDEADVAQLKAERRAIIERLRSRLRGLTADERADFLEKIRARRKEVRDSFREHRQARRLEIQRKREDRRKDLKERRDQALEEFRQNREDAKARLRDARESFKENLNSRRDAATQRRDQVKQDAKQRFQDRVITRKENIGNQLDSRGTRVQEIRKKNVEAGDVQGAIDYQPESFIERIGYFIQGI